MKVNVKKSIEIQKRYEIEKYSNYYRNCMQVLFKEQSDVKYAEGIFKIKSQWIDHAWLIINKQIIDLSFIDTQAIIPKYHACVIYSQKEASILLIKVDGRLPLYLADAELTQKYITEKMKIT